MVSTSRFQQLFDRKDAGLLMIAHRGDCSRAPENTLLAADWGKRSGAVAWELDVHLTKDGVPVVIHDESLARTTNVATKFAGDRRGIQGYLVADFDLIEIESLDAGGWFLQPEPTERTARALGTTDLIDPTTRNAICNGSVTIPTLVQALIWTKDHNWLVNVELKSFPHLDARLTEVVLKTIRETQSENHVLVSSFDHREICRVVDMAPEIPVGALCATPIGRSAVYAGEILNVNALHVSADVLGASSLAYQRCRQASSLAVAEIHALRANGIAVLVYTVNDPKLARDLFDAGVTGVFSDTPGTIQAG